MDKRYGKLTVRGPAKNNPKALKSGLWECKCTCGTVIDVLGNSLIREYTRSCGARKCRSRRTLAPYRNSVYLSLVGTVSGVLYIIAPAESNPKATSAGLWDCECIKCKKAIQRTGKHLKLGHSKCISYTCRHTPTVEPIAPIVKPRIKLIVPIKEVLVEPKAEPIIVEEIPVEPIVSNSERRLQREQEAWSKTLTRYWDDCEDLRSLEELHEAGIDRVNMLGPIELKDIKTNREISIDALAMAILHIEEGE